MSVQLVIDALLANGYDLRGMIKSAEKVDERHGCEMYQIRYESAEGDGDEDGIVFVWKGEGGVKLADF